MYGILISVSTIFCVLFAERLINKTKHISNDNYWNVILIALFFSLLGGRVYHVLDNYLYYSQNPVLILYIWNGGLGIYGAFILSFIFIYLYSKKNKQSIYLYSDLFLFFIPIIQIAGRLGNYFNKELYGLPTESITGIYIPIEFRNLGYENYSYFHPLFFYESFALSILFILFIFMYINKKIKFGSSLYTSVYLIFYGIIRLFLENFRFNSDYFDILGFNLSIIFSIGFILLGLVIFFKEKTNKIINLSK